MAEVPCGSSGPNLAVFLFWLGMAPSLSKMTATQDAWKAVPECLRQILWMRELDEPEVFRCFFDGQMDQAVDIVRQFVPELEEVQSAAAALAHLWQVAGPAERQAHVRANRRAAGTAVAEAVVHAETCSCGEA